MVSRIRMFTGLIRSITCCFCLVPADFPAGFLMSSRNRPVMSGTGCLILLDDIVYNETINLSFVGFSICVINMSSMSGKSGIL